MSEADALRGVRIWLAGAVPPDTPDEQRDRTLTFVRNFAEAVFRAGGHIIHGSHPTLTPTLLEVARAHASYGGRKDALTLVVSRFWSRNPDVAATVLRWREHCSVYETPEATGDDARDASLKIMRDWVSDRCDAFIALGGNWWLALPQRAGVPIEIEIAIERGVPCFLIGGLGGAARDYVSRYGGMLSRLRNGLDVSTNADIALSENVDELAATIVEQLGRLPLVRGRVNDGMSFRILALDGGGIKGAYTAAVLATLEDRLKVKVADHFDLIAGTSTGGILAIGLGMGLSPSSLLDFYRERGHFIFPITGIVGRAVRKAKHLAGPKFSQADLQREIEAALLEVDATTTLPPSWFGRLFRRAPTRAVSYKSRTLAEARSRLVIPAYDAVSGACHIFRTPHHELLAGDAETSIAEVALATAAAPTYFSAARVKDKIAHSPYIDGGVWANSPTMAAIIEATCYLKVPLDRLDILSIGTTTTAFTAKQFSDSGVAGWGANLVELLMNAQVESSLDHAKRLVGEPKFLRINASTPQGLYSLDNAAEVESLIALGQRSAADPSTLSQVKSRFLNGIAPLPWR